MRTPAPAQRGRRWLLAALLLLAPPARAARPRRSLGGWPSCASAAEGAAETPPGPPAEHEALRQRLREHTRDLWRYLRSELRGGLAPQRAAAVLDQIAQRKRFLLSDQERMGELDGHEGWRRREVASLAAVVRRRLLALQNPPDCRAARKVVYALRKKCGFACQMHDVLYALIYAYATRRTLVLQSKGWTYHPQGWEEVLQPLSENCTSIFGEKPVDYRRKNAKVVRLESFTDPAMLAYLPPALPQDLADRVAWISGDPVAWYVGQVLSFLLRPTARMQRDIQRAVAKMNVRAPYVGIHVRRTDKLRSEAKYYALEEYMVHVEDYFATRQLAPAAGPRRVYVASDDPSVIKEARKKYSSYEFLGDPAIAELAALHARLQHPPSALTGVLVDVLVLAGSEHFVGTLSSNVGRMVYEYMQSRHADGWIRMTSLDSFYHVRGVWQSRVAVVPHVAVSEQEISVQKGDFIHMTENLWNGYGRGTNKRTTKTGLVPWFKTKEHLALYSFPNPDLNMMPLESV